MSSSSTGCGGFETVAAQPPQPPVVSTPVVTDDPRWLSRECRSATERVETLRSDGWKVATVSSSSTGCGGFETVAAQPPQPPVVSTPVVTDDPRWLSRECRSATERVETLRSDGWKVATVSSSSTGCGGFETVAAQPPQPPVVSTPVVTDDPRWLSRECRSATERVETLRSDGWKVATVSSSSTGCGGFETVAAQPPQPPVVSTPVVTDDPRWLSRECRAATERVETLRSDGWKVATVSSSSTGCGGFETVAAQPPQPPVVSTPVVTDDPRWLSRECRSATERVETLRSDGWKVATVSSSSTGCGGFETVAAQPPQPPVGDD